jgi:hypothetical protein
VKRTLAILALVGIAVGAFVVSASGRGRQVRSADREEPAPKARPASLQTATAVETPPVAPRTPRAAPSQPRPASPEALSDPRLHGTFVTDAESLRKMRAALREEMAILSERMAKLDSKNRIRDPEKLLADVERSVAGTVLSFSRDTIRLSRGDEQKDVPYRVIARSGDTLTLEIKNQGLLNARQIDVRIESNDTLRVSAGGRPSLIVRRASSSATP